MGCNVLLGIYFTLHNAHGASFAANYGWMALIALIGFLSFFSIGAGPIPWMMIPEMTPYKARPFVTSLATCVSWSIVFVVTKYFTGLTIAIGVDGAFYFLAGCSLLMVLFVAIFLPETKGRSFEELERLFK